MATLHDPAPRYGIIDAEYEQRLTNTPPEDDGPVWMINLMSYRDHADYADGRATTLTGREADDLYTPLASLNAVGATVVFFADVDTQLMGASPQWHRVAVVKYPTRRAFIDMQTRPEFVESHAHKEAGMAHTIIIGAQPITFPTTHVDLPDWADVPHPPTTEDGSVVLLHLIRFHPGGADNDMVEYQQTAGEVAVPHGVRISGWFGAEGVIVGDGRSWDQARFNAFPSKTAFMTVALDPRRIEAQKEHRETAIADTYTMILRPLFDHLAESRER